MSIEIYSVASVNEMIDVISECIMINVSCYLYIYTNNIKNFHDKLIETFALSKLDYHCCDPVRIPIACVTVLTYYNNHLKDNEYCFFEVF